MPLPLLHLLCRRQRRRRRRPRSTGCCPAEWQPKTISVPRLEAIARSPARYSMWFRVLSPAAVREGVELDSGCRGHIDEGEVVRALDVKSTRVRKRHLRSAP